jgi:DNA-directed RNA polymerase specialized sigma24 family protein
MKEIRYKFVNKEEITVEVSDDFYKEYSKIEIEQKSVDRRETRVAVSMEYCESKGLLFSADEEPDMPDLRYEEMRKKFHNVIKKFTKEQRIILMKHFVEKKSFTEIAKELGVSRQSLTERINWLVKKIMKNF